MAKVYFDFGAATNGTGTPNNPRNTIAGYTFVAGDEHYFRRGTNFSGNFSLTAGYPGKRTKYGAWYYPDGSDDQTKPKPQFNLFSGVSSISSTNKDNVEISSLDLRILFTSVVVDAALVFLGNNSSITNCNVDSNLGCIGVWNKSNVVIAYNTLNGVKYNDNTVNNNVLVCSNTIPADNVIIMGNRVYHGGGGGSQSHAIRAEGSGAYDFTNVIIDSNEISPPDGIAYNSNVGAQGIRLQRCPGAKIRYNKVHGMLSGAFVVGGGSVISVYFGHNDMSYNLNFGIHLTTDTNRCVLEYNTCSYNGTSNTAASAYGRGIELSSGAGQGRCANHVVRYNVCDYNKNYGGPSDNGSEGVGIGLDDGTMGCLVYGNFCRNNEGNGVQLYGGDNTTTWTDTGNNMVVANYLENNCTASVSGRRSGGVAETAFIAHVGLASTYGGKSHIANNVFVGGKLAISITNNCTNVEVSNNIMIRVPNGIQFGGTPGGSYNNVFFKDTLPSMNKYCTMATGTGNVTFTPLSFNGVNDLTSDPTLDVNHKLPPNSICIAAGRSIGNFIDAAGKPFKAAPSIGMYEWYPDLNQALRL